MAGTYKPTKAERAAIRKGEAEIRRGDYVTLEEFLRGPKGARKRLSKRTRKATR